MEDWRTYKLKDISKNASRRFDFGIHQKAVFINTSDVLKGKFLHSEIKDTQGLPGQAKKAIKKGDILFSEIRPNNKRYAFVDFDTPNYVVSTKFMVIESNDSIVDKKFFFQLLTSNERLQELQSIAEGRSGTFPQITFDAIGNIDFYLPSLPEQRAIASILSALDEKIEINLQMNKTLEEMAMALYKHWFVDFGPFQNGKFVETEMGMIPEGWKVNRLEEFVKHQKGFAFKSSWYQENGKIVVRVSDTTSNSIDLNTCNKISDERASNYKAYELKTNDIIIATVGSWPPNYSSVVGKVVRVPSIAEGGLLNQNAVRLTMKVNDVNHQGLLYCTLKTDRFLNYIVSSAQGSASQASIKLTDIFNYPIPFGEDILLDGFSNQIESFLQQQNLLLAENQTLTTLRDTLLPKLISGQIRLKDAEQMVVAAL